MLLPPIVPGRFCDGHWLGLLATLRLEHFQNNDNVIAEIIHNATNSAFNVSGCILQYWDRRFSFSQRLSIHLAITHSGGGEESLSQILLRGREHMDSR